MEVEEEVEEEVVVAPRARLKCHFVYRTYDQAMMVVEKLEVQRHLSICFAF